MSLHIDTYGNGMTVKQKSHIVFDGAILINNFISRFNKLSNNY